MSLCRFEAAQAHVVYEARSEGDIRTKLDAPRTGGQTARRPEGGTLNSGISKKPCGVIG